VKRRDFIIVLGGASAAWPLPLSAQQPGKLPTIGYLGANTPSAESQRIAAFVQRLRELGWIEGRTVAIEVRWAEGRYERFAEIAAEFVRLKVYVGAVLGAEGVLAPSAADALRTRQRLGSNAEIWADLFDRTSIPLVPQPLEQIAEWATKFGGASVVIVTGDTWATTMEMARTARRVLPDTPVAVGGGVSLANVREALDVADVAIVGSALEEKPFTGPVSASKARALAQEAGLGLLTH